VESGLYGLQEDPVFPKDCMAASGRYIAFQVIHPSPKVRMLVSGTAIYLPGGPDLPPASVVGSNRVPFPLIGQGGARVVSDPLSVYETVAGSFLVLDLGRIPSPSNQNAPALLRDTRQIILHIRDVSLLSEADYEALVPPSCLKCFPQDLAHKDLEFSGCTEDGSISRQSWFRLLQPQGKSALQIRGDLPSNGSTTVEPNLLIVKWNGVEVGRKSISSSEFALSYPVPSGSGPGKVELDFVKAYSVPQSTFKLSAKLSFVGFE
jgi:hypothetical protein